MLGLRTDARQQQRAAAARGTRAPRRKSSQGAGAPKAGETSGSVHRTSGRSSSAGPTRVKADCSSDGNNSDGLPLRPDESPEPNWGVHEEYFPGLEDNYTKGSEQLVATANIANASFAFSTLDMLSLYGSRNQTR